MDFEGLTLVVDNGGGYGCSVALPTRLWGRRISWLQLVLAIVTQCWLYRTVMYNGMPLSEWSNASIAAQITFITRSCSGGFMLHSLCRSCVVDVGHPIQCLVGIPSQACATSAFQSMAFPTDLFDGAVLCLTIVKSHMESRYMYVCGGCERTSNAVPLCLCAEIQTILEG